MSKNSLIKLYDMFNIVTRRVQHMHITIVRVYNDNITINFYNHTPEKEKAAALLRKQLYAKVLINTKVYSLD